MRVGDGKTELGTCVPAFWRGFRVGIIKVDRDHIVGLTIGIALREQQNAPGRLAEPLRTIKTVAYHL